MGVGGRVENATFEQYANPKVTSRIRELDACLLMVESHLY